MAIKLYHASESPGELVEDYRVSDSVGLSRDLKNLDF